MNRERAKEILPIIEAFANGEKIEFKHPVDGRWFAASDPQFDDKTTYRIQPEPREFWVRVKNHDGVDGYRLVAHCEGAECIKVREVLDNE